MRPLSILIVTALLLTSCAYQGTIVEKDARESPFYHSTGMGAVFSFLLRDSTGAVHRQLVTPEVYQQYAIGDYFNDLQPAPVSEEISDGKVMKMAGVAPAIGVVASAPVRTSTGVAKATQRPPQKVAVRQKGKSKVAQRSAAKSSRKVAAAKSSRKVAAAKSSNPAGAKASQKTATRTAASAQSTKKSATAQGLRTKPSRVAGTSPATKAPPAASSEPLRALPVIYTRPSVRAAIPGPDRATMPKPVRAMAARQVALAKNAPLRR